MKISRISPIITTLTIAAVAVAFAASVQLYRYVQLRMTQKNTSSLLAMNCHDPKSSDEKIYFVSCGGMF